MVKSMTAFARVERHGASGTFAIELRTVNHRYLELAVRMPEEVRAFEPLVRDRVNSRLQRGKVDCNIRFQPGVAEQGVEVNTDYARQLAHASRTVDGLLYNAAPVSSLDLMKWPGVLKTSAPDPEQLQAELAAVLDEALEQVVDTRLREGGKLKELLLQRCRAMGEHVPRVRAAIPAVMARYRERLQERLAEFGAAVDDQRLEQELAILAQKMDVDEELDRLEAHLGEVQRVLERDEPVGRRLDFLMQELNREANTLASKSADAGTTRDAVELKVLIEQMREQVQNIE